MEPVERERVLAAIAEYAAAERYMSALGAARGALADDPDDAVLRGTAGSVLFEAGRFREARDELAYAVEHGARRPDFLMQLGWASLWTGAVDAAHDAMRFAVGADSANWQAHFGMGAVLRAMRHYDEALASYRVALQHSPRNAACMADIAGCLIDARRFEDAREAADLAVAAHPEDAAVLGTLCALLLWQDRYADANAIYARIAALQAVRADPLQMPLDAGFALRESGRVDEALAFYAGALPQRPDRGACVQYAFTLLKAGRLRDGFTHYEFRWMIDPLHGQRLPLGKPAWNGQPLAGRTLLVTGEQGYGDLIQFLRYLPKVKAMGARLIMLLRKPMRELFVGMAFVDQIVDLGEPLPEFDFHVPLLSLARVLGTELDTIPADVPYVRAQPAKLAHWRARIAPGAFNVGLVWAGDPVGLRGRQKSLPLAALASLAAVPGVRLYSLQKGAAAEEARTAPTSMRIVDLAPDIQDFADTAAIVASLDLLVSVCTSVAHLAGAMGVPAWTILPEPADWRWMTGRSETPWYPTMRLFRQPVQGDWASVVADVRVALQGLVEDRERITTSAEKVGVPMIRVPTAAPKAMLGAAEARDGIFQYRPDATPEERAIAHYGDHLRPQLDLLDRLIGPGATVLEAGSGIGTHAVALAKRLGAAGHLFLSEPRAALSAILRNNVAANPGCAVTFLRSSLAGGPRDGSTAAIDDATATIDQLWLRRLDGLKVGEGMDAHAVVAGAAETLWSMRAAVIAAVRDESEMQRVAGCLRDFGYHCARVATPRFDPENFNRRGDDIFVGDTALAVLAVPEESDAIAALNGLTALH